MAIRVLTVLIFFLSVVTIGGTDPPLRVVDSVDLNRYAGKWFEIARLPNKSQHQCAGDVVVQYAARADARVDVVKQCRAGDGQIEQAHGIARRAGDGKNNAVLQVRFAPSILSFLPMVWRDYWIIGLGPDYTWSVVGAPGRDSLWILSRTPHLSNLAYEQALEIAKGNGFDVTKVVKTEHTN